jgi:hypothetical protein
MRAIMVIVLTATMVAPAMAAPALGAGAVPLPTSPSVSSGGTATGGGAIGSAATTAGGSQGQLMQATPGMKDKPMSFNMQDLQKPGDPKRKH